MTGGSLLDEAYDRLGSAGPEWGGNLSNHGPMAAEVLARRGMAEEIPAWLDAYMRRLEPMPAPVEPVTDENWRQALGSRPGDWAAYMRIQVAERPWRDVLAIWWARLLPGIAAGATHGVIRTSHAVRTLLAGDESDPALTELANGLAFWAARSVTIPGASAPAGQLGPASALDAVPRIDNQDGPIRLRLEQLAALPGWRQSLAALSPAREPEEARRQLAELVEAATLRYLTHGHASPVLLVHTATAPNAALHALPALPSALWIPSLDAAWAASAAITSMYAPGSPLQRDQLPAAPRSADPVAEVLDRALAHGDEHVIKFSDTALDVYQHSGDPDVLAAAIQAGRLLPSPR